MDNIFDTLTGKARPRRTAGPARGAEKPGDSKPTLSSVSTQDLIRVWKRNERPEYTAELLRRMKPTIRSAVNSYARGMENQVQVQAAKLTLDALRSYDSSFNAAPATHVFNHLKRLNRVGARRSSIIPQPESVALDRARGLKEMDRFIDEYGREPSMQELADLTGLSVKRLNNVMDDRVVTSESSTLSDESQRDTFASSDLTDRDYFEYVYASVDPIDQRIMEWTSGYHGKQALSNNDIAGRLKISAAAVSQRKGKIQRKLEEVRGLL